nr:hypothetical protein [Microbispora sitophila]
MTTRAPWAAQGGQQAQSQLEVAEMVGRELPFVAARVSNQFAAHDAGVVDEDVERAAGVEIPGGEGVDRCRVEEVEPAGLDVLDPGQRGRGAVRVACGHGDRRAGLVERTGGLQTDPAVAAGDDDARAGQVDAPEHVVGRRRRGEAGSDGTLPLCDVLSHGHHPAPTRPYSE